MTTPDLTLVPARPLPAVGPMPAALVDLHDVDIVTYVVTPRPHLPLTHAA